MRKQIQRVKLYVQIPTASRWKKCYSNPSFLVQSHMAIFP